MAASTYPLHGGQGALRLGGTPTAVGFFRDLSISESQTVNSAKYCRATAEAVHADGIPSRSVTFTALFDQSDAGQALIALSESTVAAVFQPDNNGTGADQASMNLIIESKDTEFSMDGFATISVTARVDGAITWGTVS